MLFEVRRNGKPLAGTKYPECLYGWPTIQSMARAGLTFRLDGKPWKPTKAGIERLRGEEDV